MPEAPFAAPPRSRLRGARRAGVACAALLLGLCAARSAVAETLYFPFQETRYLYPGQKNGGAALLPASAAPEQPVPLVVFLHGSNPAGRLHFWFGGGGRDLRPLAERWMAEAQVVPFVFAAPSQTRGSALAARSWQDFDLAGFVQSVVQATKERVTVDPARVVLVGHSGAGCNPTGGLASDFWSVGHPLPLALVSIDPCLDASLGRALARRPATVPLWLAWQSAIWVRKPEAFSAALATNKPEERIDRIIQLPPEGLNPHESIVPTALARALQELLGPPSPVPTG